MLVIKSLSRRDKQILELTFDISLVLGIAGRIPTDLLDQIFAHYVYTSPRNAMVHLMRLGLIKPAPIAGQMVIAAPSSYRISSLFGDEPMPMQNRGAHSIVANWRNGDPLFDEEVLDDTAPAPLVPRIQPVVSRRHADAVLTGIDVPAMLADIKLVSDTNRGRPLRVGTIDAVIDRYCPRRILPMSLRNALQGKGLLATAKRKGEKAPLWFVSTDGLTLIENEFAEPSLSRQEARRI